MSVTNPAFIIVRRPVVGHESEWTKMFDPPTASPLTPEKMAPTNPVPEVMASAGYQNPPGVPHTVQRDLLHGLDITTWDGLKRMKFFVFRDADNPSLSGNYPAGTIRVPRGVIFHSKTSGHGPPPHTIHWHGIEPTPINDGVGHCSMEIGGYTYQWQPNFVGSYFYHCHRNTVQHFEFALFGLLLIEPPDAYFATLANPAIPIGHCRDGKRRIAANLTNIRKPDGGLMANPFPGFNSNLITAADPWTGDAALKFQTDPHAMTVPYDVEALWVMDDRDSVWSDMAPDARATFPRMGDQPGVNDEFDRGKGKDGFFAFNQYNADYWFVTGVPVPAPRGGTGTIPSDTVIPPALNSGVSGTQIPINAQVGQTILVRCLDAAYNSIEVSFPVDVVITAWDGRSLGVPPYGFNEAYLLPANAPIRSSTARRWDALIRAASPISSFVTVKFIDTRGETLGANETVVMTALIPFNITAAAGTLAISGAVTNEQGAPLAGVNVALTGVSTRTAVTDASGNYSFDRLANGRYVITPSTSGFAFNPPSRAATLSGSNATGQNFQRTAAAGAFTISGNVQHRRTGQAIPGVQMSLIGAPHATVITDMFGNYRFTGLANGRYTVIPLKDGYKFTPREVNVRVNGANVTARLIEGRG